MSQTIREAFEGKQLELRAMFSRIDDKTTGVTDAEAAALNAVSREVDVLKGQLDIIDPGDQLFNAKRRKETADAKAFLKQLGGTGHDLVSQNSGASGGGDFAGLSFSREQVADLQRGAMGRQVTTKAAISSITAAMAGVSDYQLQPFPYLRDKQRVLDLIPQQQTNAPAVHLL
jgi:hypothetical protein